MNEILKAQRRDEIYLEKNSKYMHDYISIIYTYICDVCEDEFKSNNFYFNSSDEVICKVCKEKEIKLEEQKQKEIQDRIYDDLYFKYFNENPKEICHDLNKECDKKIKSWEWTGNGKKYFYKCNIKCEKYPNKKFKHGIYEFKYNDRCYIGIFKDNILINLYGKSYYFGRKFIPELNIAELNKNRFLLLREYGDKRIKIDNFSYYKKIR